MLKTMRNSFHQLKWTLFRRDRGLHPGVRLLVGVGLGPGQGASQIVARVGNERITAVEFDRQYRAQVERYRQMYQGNFSPELERALDLPRNVLDAMIERMLRLEAARRLDLHVSDEELAQKIVALPTSRRTASSSAARSTRRCSAPTASLPDRFEEELREDMLLEKYADLVKASVVVPEPEIAARVRGAQRQGHDRVHPRPGGARRASNAQPTDADLQAYLDKHKDRYRAPVQRRIKYLLSIGRQASARRSSRPTPRSRPSTSSARTPSPSPSRSTPRTSSSRSSRTPAPTADAAAKAKAESLAARAKQPGRRLREARQREHRRPERKDDRRQAAALLARPDGARSSRRPPSAMAPGEIRGPVKTQFGYHIIKLESKTPARTRSLEEARPSIVGRADGEAGRGGGRSPCEGALREARRDALGLGRRPAQAPERRRHLQHDRVGRAGRRDPGHRRQPEVRRRGLDHFAAARSPPPPSRRRAASSSSSPPRSGRPGLPPFAELKPRLERTGRAERREKDALAQLEPAAKELASGTTLAALAGRYGTEVKTTTEFGPRRPDPRARRGAGARGRRLPHAAGQAGPPVAVPNGFVLFRVLTRTEGDRDDVRGAEGSAARLDPHAARPTA